MDRDYLVDTNILRYWFDDGCPEHPRVAAHFRALDERSRKPTLFVSVITLGEIEYGHAVQNRAPQATQTDFSEFLERHVSLFDVRSSTASEYGRLKAALFNRFSPAQDRKRRRVSQLVEPESEELLGIQENDLWIAATAIDHDLVLVTNDKMRRIGDVASGRLSMENWTK